MSAFPAHPAWEFITRLYRAPGVAAACLELQERHGVDVTAMLFSLWRGSVDPAPLAPHMASLLEAARTWHRASVLPIRAARRWLKEGAQGLGEVAGTSLYKTVLAAEIDCEHGELSMLAQLADALCGPGTTSSGSTFSIADNLAAFLDASGIVPTEQDRSAIEAILKEAGAGQAIGRVLPTA